MPPLLTALRSHLMTAGVVRDPDAPGPLTPLWREPTAVPSPKDLGIDLTAGAYISGGIAPGPYQGWSRWPIVEVRIRAAPNRAQVADQFEQDMTLSVVDRRSYMLGGAGGVYVIESEQVGAKQLLGADAQGYEYSTSYLFQVLRPGF